MRLKREKNRDELLHEGAARLLARAGEARGLTQDALLPRLHATLQKYLLRNQPEATREEVERFLDSIHADELLLVIACERGDESAWSDLMERYRATVLSAARSASGNETEAAELAQSVWAELYGLRRESESGHHTGKLAYYSGCGSLGGWLRAVVGQLSVDRHRKSARFVQAEEASDFDRLKNESEISEDGFKATETFNPERELMDKEAAQSLCEALSQSIDELDAEDRLLVKLYYFDNLRLREAGAVLGVHEATASRRLARLHVDLRRRVEAILKNSYGWTGDEIAHSLGRVAAHLDADIQRMLTIEATAVEKSNEL